MSQLTKCNDKDSKGKKDCLKKLSDFEDSCRRLSQNSIDQGNAILGDN